MKTANFSEARMKDKAFLSLAQSALMDAFPNPGRVDCPDVALRQSLAFRKRDLLEHWDVLDHVSTCSPCFSEHIAFRNQVRSRASRFRLVGSAILLIGLSSAYVTWRARSIPAPPIQIADSSKAAPSPVKAPPPVSVISTRLDFTNWTLSRGTDQGSQLRTPVIARGRLSVTIQLPLLSPPGLYRLVLSRDRGPALIDRSARAVVSDGSTVLENLEIDTTTAPSGTYQLSVLRDGAIQPRVFPIRIE
jgi:hypothetical protein